MELMTLASVKGSWLRRETMKAREVELTEMGQPLREVVERCRRRVAERYYDESDGHSSRTAAMRFVVLVGDPRVVERPDAFAHAFDGGSDKPENRPITFRYTFGYSSAWPEGWQCFYMRRPTTCAEYTMYLGCLDAEGKAARLLQRQMQRAKQPKDLTS